MLIMQGSAFSDNMVARQMEGFKQEEPTGLWLLIKKKEQRKEKKKKGELPWFLKLKVLISCTTQELI